MKTFYQKNNKVHSVDVLSSTALHVHWPVYIKCQLEWFLSPTWLILQAELVKKTAPDNDWRQCVTAFSLEFSSYKCLLYWSSVSCRLCCNLLLLAAFSLGRRAGTNRSKTNKDWIMHWTATDLQLVQGFYSKLIILAPGLYLPKLQWNLCFFLVSPFIKRH